MMTDLFGQMPLTVNLRAYAGKPGAGPNGKTCRSCAHYTRNHTGAGNVFLKCALVADRWTHGPGTDIKASTPACEKFEPDPPC